MLRRILLAAGLVLAAGCGSHATVAGTVTLDGAPLPNATVVFTPADGGGAPAYGTTGPDGRFTLSVGSEVGLPPGEYAVGVSATGPPPANSDLPPALLTPAKYRDGKTSGLKETVGPGANTVTLKLEKK